MRRFRDKNRTDVYVAAVEALSALVAAEGTDAAQRAYSEATADALREMFIRKHGLKESRGDCCIRKLTKGRHLIRYWGGNECECHPPAADHVEMFLRDGKPAVYVSQPYQLSLKDMRETVEFCDRHGLDVGVTNWYSWHFPGAVLTIEYERRES